MAPAAVTKAALRGWLARTRYGRGFGTVKVTGRGGAGPAGRHLRATQRHSAAFMSTFSPQVRTLTLRGKQDRRPRGHRGPRRHCGWPGADCRLPPREGWSVGGGRDAVPAACAGVR